MADDLTAPKPALDVKLLELLACPLTKSALRYRADTSELISAGARLAYPVRDGIAIMLPSEARPLTDEELQNPL